MALPTPSVASFAVPVPHERGVFRADSSFPGMVLFNTYNCAGDLVEITFIAEQWCDKERERELNAALDRQCPPEEHYHKDPPFPGRLPFQLLTND